MTDTAMPAQRSAAETTVFAIIFAVSFCHLLNDMMQSLLAAIYPMLKENYGLNFKQIGILTLIFQGTASLLQPLVGTYTDKRPMPYSLPVGMAFSLAGLATLSFATHYAMLLVGAALIGIGSSIFHPESSRVARLASGGRHGLAQSLFQVGGNFGTALGPLLAGFIVLPYGQKSIIWFSAAALLGMIILYRVGSWYQDYRVANAKKTQPRKIVNLTRGKIMMSLFILTLLVFTKNIYMVSISSYYTFYVIHKFQITVQQSQMMLFLFLGAAAAGTILGGPIGDRIGTKAVIWFSILGVLPFTLMMPYANLFWTGVLTVIIGFVLSSAFSAIVVFAQELVPGRVGMVAGIFFGFAFGMAGLAAAVLGFVADSKGIDFVYQICAYLPFLGLLTIFLPSMREVRGEIAKA
ncbi:FSR family fosmidomycin resistance protein-like MFS transporter [Phyllobacterium ifriqiyense]|uniref:FSR family fosmidomycin resistance protein-like MFS transporter n=1 Tax=Phyllobacterium ifriqiyense TaxID=314238 RepID=A0ABU0S222_9HYPH|nr:MFS transporter [Phyllobacterium ifriqiyense]MDQ0994831.1 FSR family fosmidomycin resistance protein-like MFS transporter [Phyllobacterium ifriqiyense]